MKKCFSPKNGKTHQLLQIIKVATSYAPSQQLIKTKGRP